MKFFALVALAALFPGGAAHLCANDRDAEESEAAAPNVNSRYTVESIEFSGGATPRVSAPVLETIRRLIGQRLNMQALDRLRHDIGGELHARQVTLKLARGSQPERVKVLLGVEGPPSHFDVSFPGVLYVSRQGFTGEGKATAAFGSSLVSFELLSDGDSAVERFSGFRAGYRWNSVASGRVQFAISFDDFQNRYAPATLEAASTGENGPALFRSRWDLLPAFTFVLAQPLTFTTGIQIEQLAPNVAAARTATIASTVATLRFHRRWTGADASRRELDLAYSVRAAPASLSPDFAFTREEFTGRYFWRRGRHRAESDVLAGAISGNAPILDRFVLGTSTMLRGWDKFALDPLGGNRVAAASFTYGYRAVRVFYDTGAIWSRGIAPEPRQSAGAGFEKDRLLLALAFPLRQGRIDPMLIVGTSF